jgi:hypothetical protein
VKHLLLAISLTLGLTLAQADEFIIPNLKGGMNSFNDANVIDNNQASFIQNFYTDENGLAVERNGFEKKDSTSVLGGGLAVTGNWNFFDSDGNEWIISFSSRNFYKNTVGNPPSQFGLVATVGTTPDATVNLGKIWFVNGTDNLWSFDGSSTANYSGAPLGQIIKSWRNRIVIADIASNRSTVHFSEDGDGTSWTVGGNPTDSFILKFGGANDGFPIAGIQGSYLDNMIVFRKTDAWAVTGFAQDDIFVRNISREIGCIDKGTIQEFDGSLIFLSNRGMEEMRGLTITHISEPIRDITDLIVKNTINQRQTSQTTQTDWEAGTQSPGGWFDTGINAGSVQLATETALTTFVDDARGEFALGSHVKTSATVAGLAIETTNYISTNFDTTPVEVVGSSHAAQMVIVSTGYDINEVQTVSINAKLGAALFCDDFTLRIRDDGTDYSGPVVPQLGDVRVQDEFSCSGWTPGAADCSIVDFVISTTVTPGTTYWVEIQTDGTNDTMQICMPAYSESNSIYHFNLNVGSPGEFLLDANKGMGAELNITGVYSTATFTSRTFDTGFTTNTWLWTWDEFDVGESLNGETVSYETQTASSTTGPWESLTPVTNGGKSTSTVQEFFRYKVSFETETGTSPVLSDVTQNMSARIRPIGTFTTQVVDVGTLIDSWSNFAANDTQSDGAITYEFNASSQSNIAIFNSSSWTSVVSGGIPTNGVERYVAFRSSFSLTTASGTARLNSLSISWNEGDKQPANAFVYDRRYWMAYSTNTTTSPRNDKVAVYQRNRTWTLLSGINAASFVLWRDALYFGDSTDTGLVYKFDVGNDDNNSGIESVIEFKSYDLDAFNKDKDFRKLYVGYLGDTSFSGSFSLDYQIDRNGTDISLGSTNLGDLTGQNAAKFPFSLTAVNQGREIQYKLRKSGTDNRLKLYDILTEFDLKEAR